MKRIKEFVKRNIFVYKIYKFFGSFFLKILSIFVKTDDKLILFVSYGGRHFNDSPKAIYDCMKVDKRFSEYKLVWAFAEPGLYPDVQSVKIDTLKYFLTAIKARCWITNVVIERGLNFRGKKTYYFHTTHTTLPKKMGNDIKNESLFYNGFKYRYDVSCAQSLIEKELQIKMFGIDESKVKLYGYPKNDVLLNMDSDEVLFLKNKLSIPEGKKIILYAPTYREHTNESFINIDLDKWRNELADDYVLLIRMHPIISNKICLNGFEDFAFNVSDVEDNMALMKMSDCLVSDYSGIFFEYAVLGKPMFCYAYDYCEYTSERPLYFDIRNALPGGFCTEEELLKKIRHNSIEDKELMIDFIKKYVTVFGNSTTLCINDIYENIRG